MNQVFAILLAFVSVNAYATCPPEAHLLKPFIHLTAPLGDCTADMYFPDGKTAFSAYYGDWYHQNGKTAFSKYYGDWYYDNGQTAFSKYYGDWYHASGKTAYSKYYGDWYHDNGKTAFSKYYGDWYHTNGTTAYSKYYGELYYDTGTSAGKASVVSPLDMVEFILGQPCASGFNVFCAIAQIPQN